MKYGERKVSHFKMYKVKRQWLFTGMGILVMSGTLAFSAPSVHADTVTTGGTTTTAVTDSNTTAASSIPESSGQSGTTSEQQATQDTAEANSTSEPTESQTSQSVQTPANVSTNTENDGSAKTTEPTTGQSVDTTTTTSVNATQPTTTAQVKTRVAAVAVSQAVTPDADDATTAKQAYLDDENGDYATAVTDYQSQSAAIQSQISDYQTAKAAYDTALSQYQTQLAQAEQDTTTDKTALKTQLTASYDSLASQYQALTTQLAAINTAVTTANQTYDDAYETLVNLYNALPENIQNAGTEIQDYNDTAADQASALVTDATNTAYATALQSTASGVSTMASDAQSLADGATEKILVTPDTTSDGTVEATLFGKTYTDANGDGKITYEDDVIPTVVSDLNTDITNVQAGDTTSLQGSYAEVVVLFNYLKQVADTALPYETDDGSVGRVESGEANTGSNALNPNGSQTASAFSSTYASELLSAIDGTKAQLENTLQTIYDQTGNTFDETAFNDTFDTTLKQVAIQIYTDQTNALIAMAEQLKTTFDAADNANDALWDTTSLWVAPTELAGELQDAIDTATQNAATGLAALQAMPASDDFLAMAYSTGNTAAGLPTSDTISGIWNGLYSTIDWFGTTVSPLMKNVVATADPNSTTDVDGNVTYSSDFVAQHAVVFDAATALANTVTQLVVKSGEITDDLQGVLTDLLTITGDFDVTLPAQLAPLTSSSTAAEAPEAVGSADVSYYDDTTGKPVSTTENALLGAQGDTVTWTATVPANYVLNQANAAGTYTLAATDGTVTIHLAHAIATTTAVEEYITAFVAGAGVDQTKLPADVVQTVTWTLQHDLVTDTWIATPDKTVIEAVLAPIIHADATTSYVPDLTGTIAGTLAAFTSSTDPTASIAGSTKTITYHAAYLPESDPQEKTQVPDTSPSTTLPTGGDSGTTVTRPDQGDSGEPSASGTTQETGNVTSPTVTIANPVAAQTGADKTQSDQLETSKANAAGDTTVTATEAGAATNLSSATTTSPTEKQEGATQSQTKQTLPQTNEQSTTIWSLLGLSLLGLMTAVAGIFKRRHS
ncbi:LPXTG cell wall anchor domain-containing protein [Secundilactobacillus paracollinoides]|uniref:Gram-positive cocci surface proteins LPxTG domain-containing protein n=1 Tax=Secundilactobacillus paracollinoides TaxID=240427 RepID=A0A1B2IZE9_9LACO|nr:LPXTG cell wall anchor domain-containing protein [Secundilactobacillus paracollinoides]ANZ61496.1 hypothetical protein AYR61_09105 [Secundilactobacillus paracollinoides]ANZ67417.1 hypothetical protein AYR63_09855 [Secundilactobacillus paracollinoides]